jgi:hypothetical protein
MPESFTDEHGTVFTPIVEGGTAGLKIEDPEGKVSYLRLNPSGDSDDGVSTVFLYHDERWDSLCCPVCYLDVYSPKETKNAESV